jgi:hypothetical protein
MALEDVMVLGRDRWNTVFKEVPSGLHVVPLSGGCDSRAILGALLEAGQMDRAVAVTFGSPGTFDFEIGRLVAKRFAVEHIALDLTKVVVRPEDFEEAAEHVPGWMWLPDVVFNRFYLRYFGDGAKFWSGFMGDPISGSHLPAIESRTWAEAVRLFVARHQREGAGELLCEEGFVPEDVIPAAPLDGQANRISFDEQLDYVLRQFGAVRYIVAPDVARFETPFLNQQWAGFMLGLPRAYRLGQRFYREALRRWYPRLFGLPEKLAMVDRKAFGGPSRFRRWQWERFRMAKVWGANPCLNYIDFDHELRRDGCWRTVIGDSIRQLQTRRLVNWIDIDELWSDHQSGRRDFGRAITLLASLEFLIRADEGTG